MSIGHHRDGHDGPIDRKRAKELSDYFRDPEFKSALAKYDTTDTDHDIPYLGGSNNSGTTVYYDRRFAKSALHKLPYDPDAFLRIHESVEGVLIRLYGKDYTAAHDLATIAERHAVEAAGHSWKQYSDMLRPFISEDENEDVTDPPDDILLLPYLGTKLFDKMRDGRMLSKGEAQYRDKPNGGNRCKSCEMFKSPDGCGLVEGSISFHGWCSYWEGK